MQKRIRFTVAEQVEAARMLKSGSNSSLVMRQFGVSRYIVTNIKLRCKEHISRANDIAVSPNVNAICAVVFS